MPCESVVKGDSRVAEISAASILAKVERDAQMLELHKQYPAYGFDKHKGYPTKLHREVLNEIGPCPEHRRSYAPVRDAMGDVMADVPADGVNMWWMILQ